MAKKRISRRALLRTLVGGTLAAAGVVLATSRRLSNESYRPDVSNSLWQIDASKCTFCGRCATHCVLTPSAVKAVHAHAACGYCNICTGHLAEVRADDFPAAENEMCPTAAIERTHIEGDYYNYHVVEERCIGCAKCVKNCTNYSNGSLYLQILHDRCTNCNDCTLETACPAGAIVRVPHSRPYIKKFAPNNPAIKKS